jgi:selenocysteine-specific elongation factor
MTNFILATAGHVDHGKSALVKALTGTDPDRLPEEKARGITIDLGFARLRLPAPLSTLNSQLSTFSVGIVDVPGHEDFVRNMIAGVGSIDFALLVVAADDGWMPQTEEHLQILLYLGVKRIVVALTKSDLGNAESVTTQIREQLNDSPFANSQIIPTSTRTGEGIENLKSALSSELTNLLPPRDIGKPRLFVDRAFTLRGLGTVVTGTLTGGQIQRGQNVVIQPQNLSTRVRSIQSHGRDLEIAHPGTRTAVNLPDLVVGSDLNRGDVIASVGYEPTSSLDVLLTRSSRLPRSAAIKSGTSAYVHHGTRRMLAKIIFAETASLAAGESAVAQLRLGAPLLAFVGDRLIVRDASEQHTIAGGVVFNIDSTPNDFRSNHQRALLASRTVSPDDVDLAVWTEVARSDVIETSHFLERSRFSEPELAAALQRLSEHREIFLRDNVGAKMGVWRDLQKRAASVVDTAHRKHPERRGLELNQLRTELNSLSPAAFDALIVDLCGDEFVRSGSTIARRSHRASLPPELKAAADKVCAALAAKPFDPPARGSIAAKNDAVFRFLIDNGELVEVAPEVLLLRDSFEQMKARVVEFISKNGPATASQLREALQSSRRVIIPFLEYLDRIGVTQRIGDSRQLRETKSAAVARQ